MRFVVSILFVLVFSLSFPFVSDAQDASLSDDAVLSSVENPEPPLSLPESEPAAQEKSIFARASDAQIKEAQRYYKYCKQNDTISSKKDCKCAASTYLETRLELGAEATPDDIFAKNLNSCLLSPATTTIEKPSTDLSQINDKDLDEAQAVYDRCKADLHMSKNHDCECLSARFLDERLKRGPTASHNTIYITLQHECFNTVETTGKEYSTCMSRSSHTSPENVERKAYCECYARQWAKNLESHDGFFHGSTYRQLRLNARSHCSNASLYK